MKSFLYSLLPLAVSAGILDNGPDFSAFNPFGPAMLKMLPATQGSIVQRNQLPQLRNDTVKKAMRFGPFTLPSQNDKVAATGVPKIFASFIPTEKGELNTMARVPSLCSDCFVIRGTTYMEYEDQKLATPETGIYNHHAVIFDTMKPSIQLDCKDMSFARAKSGPSIFAASAADGGNLRDLQLAEVEPNPVPRGVYIEKDSKQMLMVQLMNYRPEPQKVYVVAEVEYMPGMPPKEFMESAGIIISVTGCNQLEQDFLLPTPQYKRTSPDFIVPADTMLVSAGGHMHDGGDYMELTVNGKIVCTSQAKYADAADSVHSSTGKAVASIIGMSKCYPHMEVKKGDKLAVTAYYDTDKHPMRMSTTGSKETVMGLGLYEFAIPIDSAYPPKSA